MNEAVRLPWACGQALAPEVYAHVMRSATLDYNKWHTQADDQPVVCPFPLVLANDIWQALARTAGALAAEALAAEKELLELPDLHSALGLPWTLRRILRRAGHASAWDVRFVRFDFHWTADGWRITEGNTDVAGGLVEASGVTPLVAGHYPDCRPVGDPAGALAKAVRRRTEPGTTVGLMHLTVYSEDRQQMLYLAQRLKGQGIATCLFDPTQLRCPGGQAAVACAAYTGPLALLVRFYPADWLVELPRRTGWQALVTGCRSGLCNPVSAVLTQSKRFPLAWDRLTTPLPTWRAMLPETCSPRDLGTGANGDWILKPALGNEGLDVGIEGVTAPEDFLQIHHEARRYPRTWVAQRRLEAVPLATPEGPMYPCVGVYVIDGRPVGAYGRMARRPLIDHRSREAVVLVRNPTGNSEGPARATGSDS
jgi:glutathionylspermidine synthase